MVLPTDLPEKKKEKRKANSNDCVCVYVNAQPCDFSSHFLGELVLGTYHAYTSSVLDPLPPPPYLSTGHSESLSAPVPEWKRSFPQRRGVTDAENENDISIDAAKLNIDISSEEDITPYLVPPPSRFVSPFCVNWENRDLQEKIIEFGLGNPEVYRRERWTDMQRDRRWRMFDRGEHYRK